MYLVIKTIKGHEYDYIYRSVWVDGKPKKKFVKYLGRHGLHTDKEIARAIKLEEVAEDECT